MRDGYIIVIYNNNNNRRSNLKRNLWKIIDQHFLIGLAGAIIIILLSFLTACYRVIRLNYCIFACNKLYIVLTVVHSIEDFLFMAGLGYFGEFESHAVTE